MISICCKASYNQHFTRIINSSGKDKIVHYIHLLVVSLEKAKQRTFSQLIVTTLLHSHM